MSYSHFTLLNALSNCWFLQFENTDLGYHYLKTHGWNSAYAIHFIISKSLVKCYLPHLLIYLPDHLIFVKTSFVNFLLFTIINRKFSTVFKKAKRILQRWYFQSSFILFERWCNILDRAIRKVRMNQWQKFCFVSFFISYSMSLVEKSIIVLISYYFNLFFFFSKVRNHWWIMMKQFLLW